MTNEDLARAVVNTPATEAKVAELEAALEEVSSAMEKRVARLEEMVTALGIAAAQQDARLGRVAGILEAVFVPKDSDDAG